MGNYTAIIKIAVVLIVLAIIAVASGQTKISKAPIVSDKPVVNADSLRIVDKDEYQRIVNDQSERFRAIEKRLDELESKVQNLQSQIEGG